MATTTGEWRVITYELYRAACERADASMKANNGHSFMTILKTRCQYCGRSPKVKTKCGGWFMTFLDHLGHELINAEKA